jgi:hypothetical protein
MPYIMGGHNAEPGQVQPANPVGLESPAQRAERERRAVAADSRPCGGFMLGGNGRMLGSGN